MTQEWTPNHSDISDSFMENRGNVSLVAKKFGVSRETLHKYIRNNPIVKTTLDESREFHSEDEIDLAVSLNYLAMQQYAVRPGYALQQVRYTLDKKGHSRGYLRDANVEPLTAKNQTDIDLSHEIMKLKHELAELKANGNKS